MAPFKIHLHSGGGAYANKAAKIWFEGRTQIERQQIILPNDRELIAQLTSRLGWPDSKGRLTLEPKDKMRSRGLSSPDRADAVLGAMMRLQGGGQVARAIEINPDHPDDFDFEFPPPPLRVSRCAGLNGTVPSIRT